MRYYILAVLILLCIPAKSFCADKRAFTIEDLYRLKSISDINVTPDDKSVIFAVNVPDLPRGKSNRQIWMMDLDGQNLHQLTKGEKSAGTPLLSPDGKTLAFISSPDGNANLFLMSLANGEVKKITNISTGVADPLWSPDGKFIAFSTDLYPECGIDDACNKKIAANWQNGSLNAHMADSLLYRHWNSWKDGTKTHIFLVNLTTKEIRDLTPGNFDAPPFQNGGQLQYDFSPDGAEFVYVSNHDKELATSTNSDLWLISLTEKDANPRNITASNPAYDGSPKYSPDGKYIAYRMQKKPSYESDLFRLAIFDRDKGKSLVLTESFQNWVEEFDWAEDSKSLYFSAPEHGNNPIYQLNLGENRVNEIFSDKTIDAFHINKGGKSLIYLKRSVGEPVEIYQGEITRGENVKTRQISHLNDAVASEVDIRPAESIWIDGGEGKIEVFIVKPHNFDPQKKYPLILNIHGGPQSRFADSFRGDWQVYPGAGYIVAFSNPHGSIGYGQNFTAQISGDLGGKVYHDLMKVVDSLEKLPYVDRDRMGAMGWSFGGYMINWFEANTARFKALASMMGIYDLKSFYGGTEELWWPEYDLKGQPWNSDDYEKFSPSNHVKNFKTPCMIISGERDYRIPYTQSLQFFTALQKMNVPSRLIIYSNAGHWPNWYEMALYYTAHLEWFNKYLGGEPPAWTTEQFLRNGVFDRETGKRIDK